MYYVGDFNGDGAEDILFYNGDLIFYDRGNIVKTQSWSHSLGSGALIGDFNGDGKSDALGSGGDLFLNDVGGFEAAVRWTGPEYEAGQWFVGDFNGDGMDDIFQFKDGTSGADVYLSTGSAFVHSGSWTGAGPGSDLWYVGDFNGDGRDDILRYWAGETGAEVFLSTGSEFVYRGSWTMAARADSWSVVDLNGDGRDDLMDGEGRLFMSDGSDFELAALWDYAIKDSVYVADFDGDGRIDSIHSGVQNVIDAVRQYFIIKDVFGTSSTDLPAFSIDAPSGFSYVGQTVTINVEPRSGEYEYRVLIVDSSGAGGRCPLDVIIVFISDIRKRRDRGAPYPSTRCWERQGRF